MKSILIATLVALLVPLGFWIGGYDFDLRGAASVTCYLLSIWAWVFIYGLLQINTLEF